MRDPKEWAAWILAQKPSHGLYDEDYLASLIREAQEDGAREWPRSPPLLRDIAWKQVAAYQDAVVEHLFDGCEQTRRDLEEDIDEIGRQIKQAGEAWSSEIERAERAEEQAKGWRERARAAETRVRDLRSAGFAEVADIGEWPISSERKDIVFRLARERAEAIRDRDEMLRDITGDRC